MKEHHPHKHRILKAALVLRALRRHRRAKQHQAPHGLGAHREHGSQHEHS